MPKVLENKSTLHWAWIILASCFVTLIINYSVRYGYGIIMPEMISELDFNRTLAGTIFNVYLFTYILLTPFAGYFTDRFGARWVISLCCLFMGVGLLLMGSAASFRMACFSYGIVGIGATGMWSPILAVVQRWFAPNRRGLALGILSAGYGLGYGFMGLIFPFILREFSWRHGWYFFGVWALLMCLVNGLFLRSSPESVGSRPWGENHEPDENSGQLPGDNSSIPQSVAFSAIFTNRNFWLIGLSYFSVTYGLYSITTFMVDYARFQINIPMESASLLATIHGVCQAVGVLTIMPLSDYLGRKKTILISNVFITASILGMASSMGSWTVLCVLVGVMGAFFGVTYPIYGACAGDYFPKRIMGTVLGVWTPFYGSGAIAAHWVGGLLRDSTGNYDTAFMIATGMAALAFILILPVTKKGS